MEVTDNTRAAETASPDERKRVRSVIEFPYADLDNAVEIASTLHSRAGSSCEAKELAAWMNQSASGGTFRTRLSAARMFGLTENAQSRVTLTQLGRDIIPASGNDRAAAVTAFLNVELFRVMYEQHKGNILPPPSAIERQMIGLGVSPKQKERARQTFIKSAHFAGFLDPASGRFIKPGNGAPKAESATPSQSEATRGGGGDGGGRDSDLDLDPLLIALLKKIPTVGNQWPAPQRIRWFRTFAMNVSQIYDGDNDPVELEVKAQKSDGGSQ